MSDRFQAPASADRPKRVTALRTLALAISLAGQPDKWTWDAHQKYVDALLRDDRRQEAQAHVRALLERMPNEPRVHALASFVGL